tara:strand:+ start:720 stop:1361 length:642 start_codon:yes stop_codon:yes gene_type:complete
MGKRKEHELRGGCIKKHCPTCDTWKKLEDYTNQKSSWDGLCRMCRNCMIEYKRDKRKNDPKYKETDEKYNEKYKDSGKKREMSQKRYKEKKEEIIQKCVAYNKKKYNSDSNFKLVCSLRSRINKVLRESNTKKSKKTMELTGCTVDELKKHIEKQFKPGMNWSNHSVKGWHIDHIQCCASFDLTKEEEQKKCFHYTNLQPLWAEENLSKGAKV